MTRNSPEFSIMSSLVAVVLLFIGLSTGSRTGEEKSVKFPFDLPIGHGPWINPTIGQVWPQPQLQETNNNFMILRPTVFQFEVIGKRCEILDEAIRRYYDLIFHPVRGQDVSKNFLKFHKKFHKFWLANKNFRGYLDTVRIDLMQPCEDYPPLNMDEHYEIKIDTADRPLEGLVVSSSIWGILRGLETLSQLIYTSPDGIAFQINSTLVMDFPRFTHRGLLLDSARHFLPVQTIKDNLDLMAQNKLNVFHWHLTDDPSFPFESTAFPNLSLLGSFNRYNHIYTPGDVREIIEYARLRGIRVIPEFDTPGHTQSWGPGVAGLLTECYSPNGTLEGYYGPINPVPENNYQFLKQFFHEIYQVFPDPYVHLGGDEVDFTCWQSNPQIQSFMASQGWGNRYNLLEQYYMQRLINETQQITSNQMNYLVWQEVIDNNVTLPSNTVIHVWKGGKQFAEEMQQVTGHGYRTLLSSPWYLNEIHYGIDWDTYYTVDPLAFNGTEAQKRLVIGGEACMWGEYVDAVSVIPRTWPRASAVAERLWSNENVNNARAAATRLEEHRCRLLRRGYNVDPVNGVNYCEVEWQK